VRPSISAAASTRCAADLGLGHLGDLEREPDVLPHRHVRVERIVLEHHRDVAIARRQVVDDRSPMRSSPSLISSRPAIIRSAVDLPQPDGPTSTMNSPSSISRSSESTATRTVALVLLGDGAERDSCHGGPHFKPLDAEFSTK
jgi:hypothetical protein